ncbi:hypothetical protein [Tunturiibacter gelidiferens]|uniref:hypothetical protein n=1 Tax=Tunturiibacter gelidiferens TaxID=3069689 RepID=UPI003D9B75F5
MSVPAPQPSIDIHAKALAINLDPSFYGTHHVPIATSRTPAHRIERERLRDPQPTPKVPPVTAAILPFKFFIRRSSHGFMEE